MWMRVGLSVMFAACAGYAVCQTGAAKQSAEPVYQTGVNSVLVDITVTGKGGKPVTDLTDQDFEVTDDGRPQKITYFQEHPTVPPPAQAPQPEQPDVFTNLREAPSPGAVDVLLIDTLNTPLPDQVVVRKQVIQALKTLPRGASIAIFNMSVQLGFIQGFTSDPEVLLAALAGSEMNPQFSPLLKTQASSIADDRTISQMRELAATSQSAAFMASVVAMRRFFEARDDSSTTNRIDITLQNLQDLGRYLASIPGRKNVIWFSGAFPINIFPSATTNSNLLNGAVEVAPVGETTTEASPEFFSHQLQVTAGLLRAAQVALYPVDAEGLMPTNFYDAGVPESDPGMPESLRQTTSLGNEVAARTARDATMDELADQTGGKAYYNTNGLGAALSDVVTNGQHYYTLAYTPAGAAMNGEYRHIKIRLHQGSYKLFYRRGYYATSRKGLLTYAAKQSADPLRQYMAIGMPQFNQIGYDVLVQPAKAAAAAEKESAGAQDGKPHKGALPSVGYDLDFAIPVEDIGFSAAADGVRHGTLYLSIFAYDNAGMPVFETSRAITMDLKPEAYEKYRQIGLQIHESIRLPKGNLVLRTGVYDPKSANIGTVDVPLSAVTRPKS